MSYTIMTPIYGIPLNARGVKLSSKLKDLLYDNNEEKGFLSFYTSGGDNPVAFGVIIGKDLDECAIYLDASKFVLTANEEQIEEFNQLYNAVDKEIQNEMKQFGEPRVFYLFSSS